MRQDYKNVRAKKSFGQHFLNDTNVALDIVAGIEVENAPLNVLEIGPGMGVLTQFLTQKNYNFKVVEVDRESIAYLKHNYPFLKDQIIEADFLKLNLTEIFNAPFSIIGNFPYNISSQILFKMLDYKEQVPLLVGMFQYEVAKRIASGSGNKDYGILSILIQAYYDAEYLFTVEPHVFIPPPKVRSGVIRLQRKSLTLPCDEILFKDIVKTAFNQRRKTLRNALSKFASHPNFNSLTILGKRAEQLSVEDFFELTEKLG